MLVHELLHPPLNWTRKLSGALDSVTFPSHTPGEVARSIVRSAADEYRADIIASDLLGAATGDEERQKHLDTWFAQEHATSLATALAESAHPGWPDTIERYRNFQMPLMDMWHTIGTQTDQLITLLAHAEAASTSAGQPRQLTGSIASHPAVVLYVQETWKPIITLLEQQPLLPSLDDFLELELELLTVGEDAILAMWEKLGLTFTDLPNRGFHIHVDEPLR